MAIAGKILVILGTGLLLLGVVVFLLSVLSSGEWGPGGARFGLFVAQFPGVPGAFALLLGISLTLKARQRRERNEAAEWNNASLRGIVRDPNGSPIAKATIDVFVEGCETGQPVATMRTGARGKFSALLPAGSYLVEISVPEAGESRLPVTISPPENIADLEVKMDAAPSAASPPSSL
jgi:hypothetical protein